MTNFGHSGTSRAGLIVDETGNQYGRLTVVERGGSNASGAVTWVCRCECGSLQEIVGQHLRKGRSAQCAKCSHRRDRRTGLGAHRRALATFRVRSRKAGIEFPLTIDEFVVFVGGPCHYCGSPPTAERRAFNRPSTKGTGPDDVALFHSIDRVDSSRSYEIDNIVACCFDCNRMKSDYGADYFLRHIAKIYLHQHSMTSQPLVGVAPPD